MNCKELQGSKYEPTKNDKFTLLYLGTLDPSRFLIDLPDVVKDIPDVRCVIGGRGRPDGAAEPAQGEPNRFTGKHSRKPVLPGG